MYLGAFLLVENGHLLILQPKVIVLFEQRAEHSFSIGALGGHDGKQDGLSLCKLPLKGEDLIAVLVQKALFNQQLCWQRNLDAGSSVKCPNLSYQHEGC